MTKETRHMNALRRRENSSWEAVLKNLENGTGLWGTGMGGRRCAGIGDYR